MISKKFHFSREDLLRDTGLLKCPKCYRESKFVIALLVGAFIVWLLHDHIPVFKTQHVFSIGLLFSLVIWQPFIEEILFRGVIQGQLIKHKWAQQNLAGITLANVATSILFVILHLITVTNAWSLLVIVPSIVFGYMRDNSNSVYPSIFLHIAYNLFVITGVLFSGNAVVDFGSF